MRTSKGGLLLRLSALAHLTGSRHQWSNIEKSAFENLGEERTIQLQHCRRSMTPQHLLFCCLEDKLQRCDQLYGAIFHIDLFGQGFSSQVLSKVCIRRKKTEKVLALRPNFYALSPFHTINKIKASNSIDQRKNRDIRIINKTMKLMLQNGKVYLVYFVTSKQLVYISSGQRKPYFSA